MGSPQLQVLWPIVVTDAVAMVDLLAGEQATTNDLLHDDSVLEIMAAT